MVSKTVKIANKAGIHCRPSSMILLEAQKFSGCSFKVKSKSGESGLNSMLSLIALGLGCGEEVTIEATGAGEEEACERIAELFAYEFDFPQSG